MGSRYIRVCSSPSDFRGQRVLFGSHQGLYSMWNVWESNTGNRTEFFFFSLIKILDFLRHRFVFSLLPYSLVFLNKSLSCSLLNGWGAHRVKKSMTDDYTNNLPFCLKVYDISTHKHLETLNGESLVVTSNRLLWVWAPSITLESEGDTWKAEFHASSSSPFPSRKQRRFFFLPGLLMRSILTHAKRLFSAGNKWVFPIPKMPLFQ